MAIFRRILNLDSGFGAHHSLFRVVYRYFHCAQQGPIGIVDPKFQYTAAELIAVITGSNTDSHRIQALQIHMFKPEKTPVFQVF